MARSDNNLKAVLQDTADAIREKKGSSDLIVPRDFADEIETLSAGGVYDFSDSKFTSLNMQLFYNNTSFLDKDIEIDLPSTLTSISTNIWQGAKGNYKVVFNSKPTVSSNSYIPANTTGLTLTYYFDFSYLDIITATGWADRVSQLVFHTTNVASGTALQPYTTNTGAAITWYSDEALSVVVTESAGADNTYYCKILNPSTRVVYYLEEVDLMNATCSIVDSNNNQYSIDGNRFIPVGATLTISIATTDPIYDLLLAFRINGVDYSSGTTATITANSDLIIQVVYNDVAVSNVLDYNSWNTIKEVSQDGVAANYWAIGDTKTDLGTDGVSRTMRICDMQGLYGKHVVFEQVELETTNYVWNPSSNTDDDSCYNNYNISQMRSTHLPAIMAKYSSELQALLTDTTYKVAKNGNSSTVLELTDKLFLPAERELYSSRSYSRQEEWNALTEYQYYVTNSANSYRIKYKSGTAGAYWQRSPYSGSASYVCGVYALGDKSYYYAYDSRGVAPCFAW